MTPSEHRAFVAGLKARLAGLRHALCIVDGVTAMLDAEAQRDKLRHADGWDAQASGSSKAALRIEIAIDELRYRIQRESRKLKAKGKKR